MKKRIITLLAVAACAATLTACGGNTATTTAAPEVTTTATEQQAAAAVSPSDATAAVLAEVPITSAIEKGVDNIPDYFTMKTDGITAASFYICASGAYPDEIGCIQFETAEMAETAKATVQARIDKQTALFTDYTPAEVYKLEGAVLEVKGNYIYYLICSDNAKAQTIMDGFFA